MFSYLIRRITYALPIMLGVALVCFALVHLAPGDPLVSILPPDASQELAAQMRELYGFNRSYPEQFAGWVWRALQGDLGTSIASGRPVATEVIRAVGNTLRLAAVATLNARGSDPPQSAPEFGRSRQRCQAATCRHHER